MSASFYPTGADCVWIASDGSGALAAFITAGEAPIPELALGQAGLAIDDIEERILALPAVASARVLVNVPRPEGYNQLAVRGLYVYDWTDIHKTASDAADSYELVAVPSSGVPVSSLGEDLRRLAELLKFDVTFSEWPRIDVRQSFHCLVKG